MSRKKRQKAEIDTNSWLGTYSDTITLLMTFFVLLYAFSTTDAAKFKSMSSALQGAFNGRQGSTVLDLNMNDGNVPIMGTSTPMTSGANANNGNAVVSYDTLMKVIKENKLEKKIVLKVNKKGYILELKDKIFFDIGKADLKTESKPILDILGNYIRKIPNEIIIEGHTDTIPISNYKYQDNLALSSDRANNVMRYFINTKKLNPKKFSSLGLGEYYPISPNNSEFNRSKNRRVNIIIVANVLGTVK